MKPIPKIEHSTETPNRFSSLNLIIRYLLKTEKENEKRK